MTNIWAVYIEANQDLLHMICIFKKIYTKKSHFLKPCHLDHDPNKQLSSFKLGIEWNTETKQSRYETSHITMLIYINIILPGFQ